MEMATVKCAAGKRSRTVHELNDRKKYRIYCYGWRIDNMIDELIHECIACPDHVNNAQDGREAWNRRAGAAIGGKNGKSD